MTIYLPEGVSLFRQAFDAACNRIFCSDDDITFYTLSVELIARLQEHPFFKDYIHGLEAESLRQKHEFSIAALETLEDSWMKLWRYHRHSFKHCKQLVRIKRIVTAPDEMTYSSLYSRIRGRMWEFRHFSPFYRFIYEVPGLFKAAQSELRLTLIRFNYFYPSEGGYFDKRKVVPCKLKKGDPRRDLHKKLFNPGTNNAMPFKRPAECINPNLFSIKIEEIKKRFLIPGQSDYEKRRNMQVMAETNPIFCWERMWFLQRCHTAHGAFPALLSKGRWLSIRETAWTSAQERCEIEVLLGAKMALVHKLSFDPCSPIDSFLMSEHQIHRKDYEIYLQSLKNHIHAQLVKIQDTLTAPQIADTDTSPLAPSPQSERLTKANNARIERENYIIEHAEKYWAKFPSATHPSVFKDYKRTYPQNLRCALTKWKEIIKSKKLDPRTTKEKKLGSGRPSK